jgi:MFS family permease
VTGNAQTPSSATGLNRFWFRFVAGAAIFSVAVLAVALIYLVWERDIIGNYLAFLVLTLVVVSIPFVLIALRLWEGDERRALALAVTWGMLMFLLTAVMLVGFVRDHLRGYPSGLHVLLVAMLGLASGALVAGAIKACLAMRRESRDLRIFIRASGEVATGFLLVVLVAAFTMPTMGHNPKGNHARAVRAIRKIQDCAARYALRHPGQGFPTTLAEMGPGGDDCIDPGLAVGNASFYHYTYTAGAPDSKGRVSEYTVRADPYNFEQGIIHYMSDQTGRIRWTAEPRVAGPQDPPIK